MEFKKWESLDKNQYEIRRLQYMIKLTKRAIRDDSASYNYLRDQVERLYKQIEMIDVGHTTDAMRYAYDRTVIGNFLKPDLLFMPDVAITGTSEGLYDYVPQKLKKTKPRRKNGRKVQSKNKRVRTKVSRK